VHVILIHGYLAPAALLWPLSRRLRRAGHDVEIFSCPSRRGTLGDHAEALARRLDALSRLPSAETALVGHSLGGLLLHRALQRAAAPHVTRQVFIATPHRGSRVARRTARMLIARWLSPASRSASWGVDRPVHPARIGVVVGTRDRMVTAEEADLLTADDRVALPYGHNELLLRPKTAAVVGRFLNTGFFDVWGGVESGDCQSGEFQRRGP